MMWLTRQVAAATALAAATLALGIGIAALALVATTITASPERPKIEIAAVITALWTLAELVIITAPNAVVAGLAPHARTGTYVGRYQGCR